MQDVIKNKSSQRKTARRKIRAKKKNTPGNSRRACGRAAERHLLSIYAGTTWLGNVEQRGDRFTAKSVRGKKIGCFDSLTSAADAVSAIGEAA
jgi:hypothetical protein